MTRAMKFHLKNDVKEWLMPSFSTTTEIDRFVSGPTFMAAMRYFTYTMQCLCGFSQVTLMGTLKEWKEIRKRADGLLQYGNL